MTNQFDNGGQLPPGLSVVRNGATPEPKKDLTTRLVQGAFALAATVLCWAMVVLALVGIVWLTLFLLSHMPLIGGAL